MAYNYAPILQVITWIMLAAMGLSVVIRFLTRAYLIRRNGADDVLIALAFLFAAGQSLSVVIPRNPIWGKPLSDVDSQALAIGLKTQYAGTLLFFISLVFAKFSVLVGLGQICPFMWHRAPVVGFYSLTIAWILITEFTLAFQCSLPQPWNYERARCLDRLAIHLFANIGNIMTDIALVYLPISIISPLRMSVRKRVFTLSLLSTRILVIVAAGVQVAYLPHAMTSDFTYNSFPHYVALEFVQTLSVVTSSLPFFYPFMKSLQSRGVFTDDLTSMQRSRVDSVTNH